MQDNKDIANIDEQFTDLGWEKMQGILDKEMPITPVHKRRWGWLLLLLFFGIMASGTYYNFAIKNATPQNQIPNTTVADTNEKTNTINEFAEKNKAISKTIIQDKEQISNEAIQHGVKAIIPPKNTPKKSVEKNIIQNNLYIRKENNFTPKNGTKESPFIPQNKVERNSIKRATDILEKPVASSYFGKNISIPVSSSVENSTRNSLINTERIATLFPKIIKNNNVVLLPSPELDPTPKARKPHTYSAFTGVRSDEFSGFGGFNAGLLAHYSLTPKIGLETGLMYSNTRKNIRANIDYTNVVNELYPDNMLEYRSNIEDVHNYNYFRLPLSLTYRPRNKVQFAMGVNVGHRFDNIIGNLNTQEDLAFSEPQLDQETSNYESEFEVDIPTNDPLTLTELERITVPYSLAVRRTDVAAQASLRYYPIPRLGIDINYQYGLLNMTPNTTVNRNSGLQLALVWQLHR